MLVSFTSDSDAATCLSTASKHGYLQVSEINAILVIDFAGQRQIAGGNLEYIGDA